MDAKSDLCIDFFRNLRAAANPANGSVKLPDALITWRPGNDGNMIPIVRRSLRLIFADYEIDEAAAAAMNSVEAQQIAKLQADLAAMEEAKNKAESAGPAAPTIPAPGDNPMAIMLNADATERVRLA